MSKRTFYIYITYSQINYESIAFMLYFTVLDFNQLNEMHYQRKREEEFRNTSESTNSRVMWWSIFQTSIMLFSTLWQIRHLKTFFEEKKLV